MAGRLAAVACLATIVTASLIAQPAAPTDLGVSDGTRTYAVARIASGRVSAMAPCVATDVPLKPLALKSVVTAMLVVVPRAVAVGSEMEPALADHPWAGRAPRT